jgi:hypothetical protein
MAISLDLYSSDQQTQYTDTDQNGSVNLYSDASSSAADYVLRVGFDNPQYLSYWVTSTGQSDSSGNPLYTMSTSPVIGKTATQFLYAEPGGGAASFSEAPVDSFHSVDALYYSVTLGSTDSSLGVTFDGQTAVYGDGPLIPHYGTDTNGNTGYFAHTQDVTVGTGEFYGYPAYWQTSDLVDNGPDGRGYYSDSFGVGDYYGSSTPSSQWVENGHSGSGYYTDVSPELVYAGSSYPNNSFAGSGPSGSGYYEEVEGAGSYYGTSSPSWDYADAGHSGSGWYMDSGSYGSGSYDSDGTAHYVSDGSGSGAYYADAWGEGSFSDSYPSYYEYGYSGSGSAGFYAGSDYLGSSYFYGSGSMGGSSGYWSDSGRDGYLGSSSPSFFYGSGSSGGSYGYWTESYSAGSGSYYGSNGGSSNYPQTEYAGSGDSGYGYYHHTEGSGQYFGEQSPSFSYYGSESAPDGSGFYMQGDDYGSGFFLGEHSAHYEWVDDGAGGSGYYSDAYGSGTFNATPPSTIYYGDGPSGSGWYEDSEVITDFYGPMGTSARHFSDGVNGSGMYSDGWSLDSSAMSVEFSALNNPANIGNSYIYGTLEAGKTVDADIRAQDVDGVPAYNSSWVIDWAHADAPQTVLHTGPNYQLQTADIGKEMMYTVTFMDDAGNSESVSYVDTGNTVAAPAGSGGGSTAYDTQPLIDMLVSAAPKNSDGHVAKSIENSDALVEAGLGAGDYAYVDRSYGGAVIYNADGTTSGIDFVGNENTFILDASSEFDFFGYSYDSSYTDDSEIVVLEGSVGAGTRSIEFGESTGGVEDWDVVSFDGLDTSVILDLSAVDANFDAAAMANSQVVAYVDGAEGVFGTAHGDVITGDGGRNILHGGDGSDVVSGGLGQDLVSGGAGADNVYGGAGEDILIDIEGGDEIWGDNQTSSDNAPKYDDTFVVGQGTKVMDFDLSPDGTGLSGRANQANDIVFVQVAAASLAAAGYGLQQIYELVSGTNDAAWRSFVRDLEVEVVASDTTGSQPYNEISLSIDGNNDGQATDLGTISFLEAGTGSGNYNAVKMKSQLEGIMAQFESSTSDNAHVLEQFFGMDSLTASQVAALERAAEAGKDAEAAGADVTTVKAAIEAELTGETFEAAQAVRDALTAQVNVSGATPSDVVAAAEAVIDDVVDEALAATDMDTSLFVPVAVEEIREGTVRTEVIEDRDTALTQIAAEADATAAAALREQLLQVTTIVDREPESGSSSEPAPEAIVVLSNADDVVVSTSGADDRFEVVPQVFVDQTDTALSNQDAGKDVIVDLDSRDSSGAGGGGSSGEQTAQVDLDALGDVVYLEGVNGIGDVNFERQQIGREGQNSLKITTTVKGVDENGTEVASNASEVNIFKQFDALTDRFAIETLEISDTQGNSEYWSLSTAEAQRGDGRILDTYITTDVSNTGKGILIGSNTADDKYVVNADAGDSAEIMVVGFDANDSIDLTAFGNDLSTTVNGSDVEVSNANGDIVVTLIGLGAQTSIDEQLIGVQQV